MKTYNRKHLSTHIESLSHRVNLEEKNILIYSKNNNLSPKMTERLVNDLCKEQEIKLEKEIKLKTLYVENYFDNEKITQQRVNNGDFKENEKVLVIDNNTLEEKVYIKRVIQSREDLIQEVIEHSIAKSDGCYNLRKWNDSKYLFYTLHPKYNGELEGIDLFPDNFSEFEPKTLYKTRVKDSKKINDLLETDIFNDNQKINLKIDYQTYDGMPIGTMVIKTEDKEISLDTYSDNKKIHSLFKFLHSTLFDDTEFKGFLSEKYAYKSWSNYGQDYTYYKVVDMGNEVILESFKSMEELESSFR